MRTEIKRHTDGQILHSWLQLVPYGDYNAVKAQMVAECMVSKQIFANWLYGYCRIPKLAKSVINAVAVKYNGTLVFKIEELAGKGAEGESSAVGNAL